MWFDILKSSRDEAYAKFLEEFGPEVDLNQIKFNDRELTQDDWLIHVDTSGDITFHSEKYRPHLAFVQGMFKEEYPERYREIWNLIVELISKNQGDELPTIGEYYKLIEDVMKSIRERIRRIFAPSSVYNRRAISMMLRATDPYFITPDSNFVAQKLNNQYEKTEIIYYITANMVDRMIRETSMLRDQNSASPSRTFNDGETTELRELLIQRYYNLFMTAIYVNEDGSLGRLVNMEANNHREEVIRYLNMQVRAYLGE